MSSAPRTLSVPSERDVRLRMKPPAAPTGVVDGGWWPRSRDLAEELPAILTELWERLGGVGRVAYNLTAWPGAPRRLQLHARVVRLAGYHSQNRHSLDLVGGVERRITTLLVIPLDARPEAAEAALAAAADPSAIGSIDTLLGPATSWPTSIARTPR
jgi:uncharacterized protein DUF5994